MRTYLTRALALGLGIGLIAGCSSSQNTAIPDTASSIAQADTALPTTTTRVWSPVGSSSHAFASLPDRGELLAYDHQQRIKHSGAYTGYAVSLSEAHVLQATRPNGQLTVTAPNGERIQLTYESHVEHPDGNWTWIGRNADGAEALLTFGEQAVFGSIPQSGGDALRLTMTAGRSWLVATDRSKLAGLDGSARAKRPDQFVPPKLGSAAMSASFPQVSSQVVANANAAAAPIDVLLGYTNGFSARLGSDSIAVTRLTAMIDVTNQAYANSGVTMRVRLVKAVKVNYPDNTSNGDALEKLTGYTEEGAETTPDPAFKELREARDEAGADLVSLVRNFRTPENDGCGIAWLIGGGEQAITAQDAPFGYSVVSDGTDLDEGDSNTYFCRDETLAHELGHNMGQAHDEDNSSSTGAHAYSYGYRESAVPGFYTVMAYPIEGQQGIRYFANPAIKFGNRPTGVANQSDNVRSMNATMPIIATFRATVVPIVGGARNDFEGDGNSDVLWRRMSGDNEIWKSADSSKKQAVTGVYDADYRVSGVGDFNGDGNADIFWHNLRTGANVIWRSASTSTQDSQIAVKNQAWKVVGVGDFGGDGKSDILWRNSMSGQNLVWKSGSGSSQQSLVSVRNFAWSVVGVGDFDGDGKADILWRNSSDGSNQIWPSGDASKNIPLTKVTTNAWKVVGVGDFNDDGKADILWRNDVSGTNSIWLAGKSTTQQTIASVTNLNWKVVGVGDFNGDGRSDILWRNSSTGANTIWRTGSNATQTAVTSRDGSWSVVGF